MSRYLLRMYISLWNYPFVFQPPPPGVMPNAAQVAQAQGHRVTGTQQKAGWFEGGSGGGYTVW